MVTKAAKNDKAVESRQSHLPYNPALNSWAELRGAADEVLGYDLAKDQLFDALERVPFIITCITSRPGTVRRDKTGVDKQYSYFSHECVIAPEEDLVRRRIDLSTLPFRGGDHVVFNDGSTGIRRQVVQYLAAKEYIVLPQGDTNGPFGESVYDLPPGDWAEINVGESTFDTDGFLNYQCDVRLFAPRGLRISEYDSDFNPDGGKTRYLA